MKNSTLLVACGVATMITGSVLATPDIEANPSGIAAISAGANGFQNPQGILHDNGPTDGANGYNNAHVNIFGLRRSLLDDFDVPAGGWDIGAMSCLLVWNSGATMIGTDLEVNFYSNDNCTPGDTPVATAEGRVITETVDGGNYFGRDSVVFEVAFDCISLPEGSYYMDFLTVSDSSSAYVMTSPLKNCECWVDYEDAAYGRVPGSTVFGVQSDLTWAISDCAGADCLDMTVNALVAGGTGMWDVSGATPGQLIAIVWGTSEGTTNVDDVFGFCATFGIKGVNQNRRVCMTAADGNGDVHCERRIPGNYAGQRVLTQAAERNTCPDECTSNIDDQVIS